MLLLINHRNVSIRLLTAVQRLSITVRMAIGDTLILHIRASIFGIFTIKATPLLLRESMWLYPKICVNHNRAISEISKLREHFDESRAYS